jgi:DNA ligase-associated metallophosphoesterase
MEVEVSGERVQLYPQKAIGLPARGILLVADLHFGKINHFRRSGIPVPVKANDKNSETLIDLLNKIKPERTIFLGDLFHSHYNDEWDVVGQILKHFSSCKFELVRGNHDILSRRQYERHNIQVHEDGLELGKLWLTHEPMETPHGGSYNLSGHIHPGVKLSGRGRQAVTLPCFSFGMNQGIMPAFGSFTGLYRITPKKDDRIFVIADQKIQQVN